MKIEGDYAIIETAEESACLNLETSWSPNEADREWVLEAITPQKCDAVFWWHIVESDGNSPSYRINWPIHPSPVCFAVKANALTIGKTVGELRDLLNWCNGSKDE